MANNINKINKVRQNNPLYGDEGLALEVTLNVEEAMKELARQEKKVASESSAYLAKLLAEVYGDISESERYALLSLLSESKDIQIKQLEFLANYKKNLELQNIKFSESEQLKALKRYHAKNKVDKTNELKQQAKQKETARRESRKADLDLMLRDKKYNEATGNIEDASFSQKDKIGAIMEYGLSEMTDTLKSSMLDLNKIIDGLASKLTTYMDTYASYQSKIEARIQGTNWGIGQYGVGGYARLESSLSGAVGIQPYVKTTDLMKNLDELVDKGVAWNVEQRAFLQTISDKVATTFDAYDSTLLRIIRIQQADSTAGRLGMEAYMTRFLNSMFENTEYLTQTFDNVTSALFEATSLMSASVATEFEYQIQKWLGSLTSVGLSDQSATNIASALGALGSGDIASLSSTPGMQNLVVMAASRAGLSYSELLTEGLGEDVGKTNQLLESLVRFAQEIVENSANNNVVRAQYANIFGMSVSDLTAISNLTENDIKAISGSDLTYGQAFSELQNQIMRLPARMHISEMMQTMWDNILYGFGSNIAKNPVTYALWEVTGLINEYTGGIPIPYISAMGTGVDANVTVENLMRLGILGVSSLGMIGDLVSGLMSTLLPSSMLTKLGIGSAIDTTNRGQGLKASESGFSQSSSQKLAVNQSGTDIADQTLMEQEKENEKLVQEKEEENKTLEILKEIQSSVDSMNTDTGRMYNLLNTELPKISSRLSSSGFNSPYLVEGNGTMGTTIGDALMASVTTIMDNTNRVNLKLEDSSPYQQNIQSIENNVADILSLLQSVIEGNVLKVSMVGATNSGGMVSTVPQAFIP